MVAVLKPSIVITTKNRKEELLYAIESCLGQIGNPEIFVFDDGSSDGTYEYVKHNFPNIKIHQEVNSIGLINARTKAAGFVDGDIIFSIDDDAIFSKNDIVFETLKDFNYPKIGAVAMPLINIKSSPEILQYAPDNDKLYFTSHFIGTAHALRKDVFLRLGGYRSYLVRQGEESDYCIRLLENGYNIKLGRSCPIIHNESPKRDSSEIKYYEARNNILFALVNIPMLFVLPHLVINIFHLLMKSDQYFKTVLKGISSGISEYIKRKEIVRKPVSIQTYIKFRGL